jgi:hypothetical protein
MKKILVMVVAVLCVVFVTAPGWAALYNPPYPNPYVYSPPIDSILAKEFVSPPSEYNEINYVAAMLGMSSAELLSQYTFCKIDIPGDQKSLFLYNPGFAWDYALVKVDGPNDFSYLFRDDNASGSLSGGDDKLTTPYVGVFPFNLGNDGKGYGISHVSFFKVTSVPEPGTMMLLGLGLVGLAAGTRRFRK